MRNKYNVQENIQYLLFGQFVGNKRQQSCQYGNTFNVLKNTKTQNLRAYKNKFKEEQNTSEQTNKSKHEIGQFNQIKNVLHNFSYVNDGKKIIVVDIVENVMDELRRERKIKMVLDDAEIEEYIKLDLVEAELMDPKDMSYFLVKIMEEKKQFKLRLAQTVSILRLGYMFKML